MRKFLSVILVAALFPASVFAQEKGEESKNKFKRTKALCFNVHSLTLGNYYGGIGGKKWYSDNRAWFASVNMNYRKINDETRIESDGLSGGSSTMEQTYQNISFNIGFEHHLYQRKNYSPFIGMLFSAGGGKVKYEIPDNGTTPKEQNDLNTSLNALLGMEVWLNNNISVSGQYEAGLRYIKSKLEEPLNMDIGTSTRTIERDDWKIGINSVRMTLAFYF